MATTGADERFMRRALQLAIRARGRTAPNPLVGAVVVRADKIVGEGYHRRAGDLDAEIRALTAAGAQAAGADLYVTLEPCAHYGRTPPCVEAILRARVRSVVAAIEDPDPRVSGRGLQVLAAGGVAISTGMLAPRARQANEAFLKFKRHGLPFMTLKAAMTLDGKIACTTGDSRWVTGEAARRYAHRLRDWNDAVVVGIGTVLADDPLLTARLRGARNPVRVILDTHGRLPLDSRIACTARTVPTILACGESMLPSRAGALAGVGVEVLRLPTHGGRPEPRGLAEALAARGLMSVLVEGGGEVAASLLDADLVDRVEFLLAPKIIGGRAAPGPVGGPGRTAMADALPLRDVRVRRVGEEILICAYLHAPGS